MENLSEDTRKKALSVFYIVAALWAITQGMSEALYSNYFKDAYDITAFQRGLIEFPREIPGVICVFIMSALSFIGDIRVAIVSQVLAAIGLVVLGLITPSFGIMLIFLFINSVGVHIFFPLHDSIGMSLQGGKNVGTGLGNLKSFGVLFSMLTGLVVFFGFRSGWFSFTEGLNTPFLISAAAHLSIVVLLFYIIRLTGDEETAPKKVQIVLKKKYSLYYILCVCNGAQKQIRLVYGPWVLIDLLGKKADTIAILYLVAYFASIFFVRFVGRLLDRHGIKRSIFIQALSFIAVYAAYAVLSYGFFTGSLATVGIPAAISFVVLVLDRMTQHFTVVNAIYMREIAEVPEDITPSLTMGLALDHVVSIVCAFIGGIIWSGMGPHYVFIFTAVLSVMNFYVSHKVKDLPAK